MAGGMILMGILLAMVSVEQAMVLHGFTQLTSNAWRAVLGWRDIDWRVFRGYMAGAGLVMLAALAGRMVLSRPAVLLLLGVTPLLSYAVPAKLQLNVDRRGHPSACGAICMAIQILSGVSGPMLDTFFVRSTMTRHQVVSTKAAVQALSHASRIAFYGSLLLAGGIAIGNGAALVLVVSAIAGTTASRAVLNRLSDGNFRSLTQGLVLIVGAVYIVFGVRAWLA
jgi:hypothetical protein